MSTSADEGRQSARDDESMRRLAEFNAITEVLQAQHDAIAALSKRVDGLVDFATATKHYNESLQRALEAQHTTIEAVAPQVERNVERLDLLQRRVDRLVAITDSIPNLYGDDPT